MLEKERRNCLKSKEETACPQHQNQNLWPVSHTAVRRMSISCKTSIPNIICAKKGALKPIDTNLEDLFKHVYQPSGFQQSHTVQRMI